MNQNVFSNSSNKMLTETNILASVAASIPTTKKLRFLAALSEDDFRDRVVRPLFIRLDLKDGRDLCGYDEEGKDMYMLASSSIGPDDIWVIQTKRGNLNLASKASDSLTRACTQLETALKTRVVLLEAKESRFPVRAYLCASGKINKHAREYIYKEVGDPRLHFLDGEELIPKIDKVFPEFWLDIEAAVMPYMRQLRRGIENSTESMQIAEMLPGTSAAATDSMFVDLVLWRHETKIRTVRGKIEKIPRYVEIPVNAITTKPERQVLILGEAGSGKSTAIRRIAYILAGRALKAEPDFLIPILLRAVELVRSKANSILEAAYSEARAITNSDKTVFRQIDLETGRVVVLIDALDEIQDMNQRKSVLSLVNIFRTVYPLCRVVMTSRDYSSLEELEDLDNFTRWRIREFSIRQAGMLVEKFEKSGSLAAEESKELLRRLEEIHGMDLNPLLVTVFAATSDYNRQDIPANITELFKKFTEIMLGRWDASKGLKHQYKGPMKDLLLQQIAFEMHSNGQTSMDLQEFRLRLTNELAERSKGVDDIDQLVDEVLNRSGLFRITNQKVEFRHLLLQEFFAGRGIPSPEHLTEIVFHDWWRRAIVFYCGENPGSTSAINAVRSVISTREPLQRFTAATTLGLALQACYFVKTVNKIDAIVDVMSTLAEIMDEVIEDFPLTSTFPLYGFLAYYLYGRDSVAFNDLKGSSPDVEELLTKRLDGKEEVRQFWLIVGLLESGSVTAAEPLIKKFHPTDRRLLLALHLGCFLIQHVRVSSDEQKRAAGRICQKLSGAVEELRIQVGNEFKTQLLEVRKGEIKGVEKR